MHQVTPPQAPAPDPSIVSVPSAHSVICAGELAHAIPPLSEDALCEQARDAFEHNPGLFSLPVVNQASRPVGLVNRFTFLDRFATRFGRELTAKKCVSDLMDTDPLILDADTNIDELGS